MKMFTFFVLLFMCQMTPLYGEVVVGSCDVVLPFNKLDSPMYEEIWNGSNSKVTVDTGTAVLPGELIKLFLLPLRSEPIFWEDLLPEKAVGVSL